MSCVLHCFSSYKFRYLSVTGVIRVITQASTGTLHKGGEQTRGSVKVQAEVGSGCVYGTGHRGTDLPQRVVLPDAGS